MQAQQYVNMFNTLPHLKLRLGCGNVIIHAEDGTNKKNADGEP